MFLMIFNADKGINHFNRQMLGNTPKLNFLLRQYVLDKVVTIQIQHKKDKM